MVLVERFEDLIAWQKARELRREVFRCTKRSEFMRDIDLRRQVRRAAVSVEFNIAEGFERGSNAEFAQFLVVARGSAGELRAQLWVALDEGYITQEEFETLTSAANEVSLILGGLRASVQRALQRGKGTKSP